jgi:hypothetical protein
MSIRSLSYKTSAEVEWDGETSYNERLAEITVDGVNYLVGTSDDSEAAARASARDSYDEGLFNQSFVLNYVNAESFATDQVDSDEYYDEEVEQHPSMYIQDDPEGEDGEYSEEQKDVAVKRLKDGKKREIESDPFQYLHYMGYTDWDAMEQLSGYIDVDELVKDAVDTDGVAHFLNTYDGNQYDSDDLDIDPEYLPEDLKDFLGERAIAKDDLCYFKV